MNKTLYLHVGLHKTGTSAIQSFLGHNRVMLEQNGIYVPGDKVGENLHHHIALRAHKNYDINVARRNFRKAVKDFISLGDRIVLSSEVFSAKRTIHIEVLDELLSYFKTIRVIVYIRRGDTMHESAYNQIVKQTQTSGHFLNGRWYNLHYTQLIAPFEEMFGVENICVRPYEREQLIGGSITSDFLSCIDVKESGKFVVPERKINSSLTFNTLEYKRLINTVSTPQEASVDFAEPIIEFSEQEKRNSSVNNLLSSLMSPTDRIALLKSLEPEYALIAKKYLNRKDGRLFYQPPPTINMPWHPYPGLDAEKAYEITQFLFDYNPNLVKSLLQKFSDRSMDTFENIEQAREALIPQLKRVLDLGNEKQ